MLLSWKSKKSISNQLINNESIFKMLLKQLLELSSPSATFRKKECGMSNEVMAWTIKMKKGQIWPFNVIRYSFYI